MKRMQGFTLVEVIISIALIGIIAIAFLSAMAGHYSMTVRTRGITKDTVNAQQRMEQDIDTVKKTLETGVTPAGQTLVTLFAGTSYERKVTAYIREQSIPGGAPAGTTRKLYTVVADQRPNEFATASITGNTISLKKGGDLYPVAHYSLPALTAASTTTRSDPANVHLMYLHRWYVSRVGFNIMSKGIPLEVEPGTVFPRFPDDYVLIPGATDENLNNITSAYAGRHLVHTVLSASTSGKMGVAVPSNPVYVSGLPVTSDLRVHLDASLVDVTDSTVVRTDAGGNRFLRTWTDVEGYGGPQFNNASQTTQASQPQLLRQLMGYVAGPDGLECESHAQYASFNGSSRMSIANHSTINSSNFTAFVAFKSEGSGPNKSLIAKIGNTGTLNQSWRIGWVGEDTLGLFLRENNSRIDTLAATPFEGLDGKWHILRVTVGGSTLELQIDDGMIYTKSRVTTNNITNSNDLTIGWDTVNGNTVADIGEFLFYHNAMSAADITAVRTYLQNKFRPVPPAVFIYSMQNVVRTVDLGDTHVLPDTLPANMTNGTVREVGVTWSAGMVAGDPVDTGTPGVRTFTATTVAVPHKTATYTVQVLGISSMEPMELIVDVDTAVVLPATGTANMSNGSTRVTPVEWPAGAETSVDTSVLGSTVITGWPQLDPTKTVVLTVRVVPTRVAGVTLSPSEVVVHRGATTNLAAVVLPANAANPAVMFTSTDPAIATVDAAGVVRGIAVGSTTITVETVEGGYQAASTVHVVVPANGISLSPSSANLVPGAQSTLTATVQPADATLRTVTWTSSNPGVATVSEQGVVTGVNGGSATITARSVDGGFTATCAVSVTVPVTGVTLNRTSGDMRVNEEYTLIATVAPGNATNRNVVWSSSNTSRATVDANGLVKAVGTGSVTITVRTVDGNFSATCVIDVTSGGCRG